MRKSLIFIFIATSTSTFGKPGKNSPLKKFDRLTKFYNEGLKLKKSCQKQRSLQYFLPEERKKVQSSMVASLQFIGLNMTIRAISSYAKYFEFTKEEFQNLTNYLIGSSCSQNLSVMGLKKLKNNMLKSFKMNSFPLPQRETIFFPGQIWQSQSEKASKKQEFFLTLKLFQSFCKWGGDEENFGDMTPLLKAPFLQAFVIRQMTGKAFVWSPQKKEHILKQKKGTVRMLCQERICRQSDLETFEKKNPPTSWSYGFNG